MITKQTLEKEFDVADNGLITNAGKFVGERPYIPYFWFMGCPDDTLYDDESETYHNVYIPNGEDEINFPELKDIKRILIWEDDIGFIHSHTETKEDKGIQVPLNHSSVWTRKKE